MPEQAAADEIKRLQRCINDIVSLLALPAAWSGVEPPQIAQSLLDALMPLLSLDLVYARLNDAIGGASIEKVCTVHGESSVFSPAEVCKVIGQCFSDRLPTLPALLCRSIGDKDIRLVPLQLGLQGDIGLIVAGSQRGDFPNQTEKLVLNVAANQAAIGLHEARVFIEQKRVTSELDGRVAQRTREIDQVNSELRKEIAERKRAEDRVKRSEARYRVMVETASDAVIGMDEGGTIILANAATKRVFGYEPAELIGRSLTALMPESMKKLHEAGYKRYLATGEKRLNWQGTEVTARRANGEEFPAEVSFGEMTTDGHKVFTGFIRDISEKRRSETALATARAELANVVRVTSLGQLTASIAHEVNQPLSGIITNASTCLRMLNGDPPNIDGARETARRTIRDGNRASDVVTRLRTLFSRKEISLEPVDLNEAIREVVALSLLELQRNGIVLLHEFDEELPLIQGDRIQLQQVILNLLRNASDAMSTVDDRPRQLFITTASDAEHVRVLVKDTGIGFASEITDRLFESFYTTKRDGMGVGLSVSRSIVEAHSGHLWVILNDGPGATFGFSIPCNRRSGQDQ